MVEEAYDDYLEELDYIFIELGKEYAKISTELNTLTASHGGVDGFLLLYCLMVLAPITMTVAVTMKLFIRFEKR